MEDEEYMNANANTNINTNQNTDAQDNKQENDSNHSLEEASNSGDESKDSKDSDESKDSNDENKKDDIEELHDSFEENKSAISNESIENDDDYINLKEELDKANNLIDYFLVLGLDPSIAMNKWLYENDLENLRKLYGKELQPKILSSFPCFEKHTIAFDDSILGHCFPGGFEIIMSSYRPRPKIFSFILDNNYFNLNYPQKYLTCLLIYENITGYRMLYEQNQRLTEALKEPDSEYNSIPDNREMAHIVKNPKIYIPKCILIMSLYPYFGEFEKILMEIYNYSINLTYKEEKEEEKDDKKVKKASISINKKKKKVMRDINLPVDKIIENLCIEVPEPPRGVSYLEYSLNNEKRIIRQNLMNKLPLININLKQIFFNYEVKDIVAMYNYLFLETRILFFSRDIDVLNVYIYGLLSLLYPFQYQYQIVTILPEQNFEIMESITPFIAGINQTFQEDFFEKRGYTLSDLIVVVDIDCNRLVLINEESKVPEFPKNNEKKLRNSLQDVVNRYLGNIIKQSKKKGFDNQRVRETFSAKGDYLPHEEDLEQIYARSKTKMSVKKNLEDLNSLISFKEDNIEEVFSNFNIDYDFNREIHEIFFNFNALLLANYSKFLNLDFYSSNIMPCLEILFKVEDYLKEVPPQDKDFYEKFISETQIFGDFLYLRMIPKNSKEKIRILLFDEKINENSTTIFSKPPPMIFTNCVEYNFKEKSEIKGPRELNKDDIDYYRDLKNRKKLLEYGILITKDNNEDDKIIFKYPIFPKLTTKIFFQNMLDYSPPKNWNDIIDNINVDIISKSHLGGVTLRQSDMKNYVYLCWMQMWAMTFWYCEEIEKKYRFQQLLNVLENSHCYEMEIFNLLFEAISAYGKDYMVLKLYDLILKQHLNPSYKVHSTVMKILEKENVQGNFNEALQTLIGREMNKNYKNTDFKKRVFRNKYYRDIMSEDIIFFGFDCCTKCNKDLNLEYISKDYKNMGRDLQWAKCPRCNENLLPKISFQFGREINKSGDMRINTCYFDSAILYSPYTLKNNYKSTMLKNYHIKVDVNLLMRNNKDIFWNSLWYFKLNSLDYDFMLPYERNITEDIIPNKNLHITIKGSYEQYKKEEFDEDIPRFDYYNLQITSFSTTIKG